MEMRFIAEEQLMEEEWVIVQQKNNFFAKWSAVGTIFVGDFLWKSRALWVQFKVVFQHSLDACNSRDRLRTDVCGSSETDARSPFHLSSVATVRVLPVAAGPRVLRLQKLFYGCWGSFCLSAHLRAFQISLEIGVERDNTPKALKPSSNKKSLLLHQLISKKIFFTAKSQTQLQLRWENLNF